MTYFVKEIYYTLQGEGINAGRPAVFLRFSGCNLWNGREEDRTKGSAGCSLWCDTDFEGTDGSGGGRFATPDALVDRVASMWTADLDSQRLVVCTGGEPLLQLDEQLIGALHQANFEVAIETNGTRAIPVGIDWICVSPKAGSDLVVHRGHEIKLVYPQDGLTPEQVQSLSFHHFLLQPLDGPERDQNTRLAVKYCLEHPKWRLSLQMHKYIGIS